MLKSNDVCYKVHVSSLYLCLPASFDIILVRTYGNLYHVSLLQWDKFRTPGPPGVHGFTSKLTILLTSFILSTRLLLLRKMSAPKQVATTVTNQHK